MSANTSVRSLLHVMVFSVLLISTACGDSVAPDGPDLTAEATSEVIGNERSLVQEFPDLDEALADLTRTIPGFAGRYIDGEGRRVVLVTDLASEEMARAHGIAFGRDHDDPRDVVVQLAKYNFSQLARWKRQLRSVFSLPGVEMLDADERANRVTIGVTEEGVADLVLDHAGTLDVPVEAIRIVLTHALSFAAADSLTTRVRPFTGGLRIETDGGGACTLGLPSRNAGGALGFVTASHCSNTPFSSSPDGTSYSQPDLVGGYIGWEGTDHAFYRCVPGWIANCRRSDANWNYMNPWNGTTADFGTIARTRFVGTGFARGSLEIDSVHPRFSIQDDAPNISMEQGEPIEKVGMRTGWTRGTLTHTCVNRTVEGHIFVCVFETDNFFGPGDSGSPVFRYFQDVLSGSERANVYGIAFAGLSQDAKVMVYASMDAIHSELGEVDICDYPACRY